MTTYNKSTKATITLIQRRIKHFCNKRTFSIASFKTQFDTSMFTILVALRDLAENGFCFEIAEDRIIVGRL